MAKSIRILVLERFSDEHLARIREAAGPDGAVTHVTDATDAEAQVEALRGADVVVPPARRSVASDPDDTAPVNGNSRTGRQTSSSPCS